ncbi:HIT domain-containing protein [Paenibacillus sp. TRM 82003]|uniref:HIT family protein n=1 Tax=Kineococcus sp. TRM81007 TaxID=2925831 RepID=UPI001F58C342|nr:HIT domain-containing protein [Kineococcus sp. TRM81007]MCI2238971.1 HIT domain-containing protein [Kineococcus sp. TRM81007]MCI3924391.1 HIT domain-containing protein [Paenibacillus sp. TRM 82003]
MSDAHEPGGEASVEPAGALPGDADGFERLWTPHRMAYIRGERKPTDPDDAQQCPFCRAPSRSDEDGLVVHRGQRVLVVLNLYPYNPGHLLVCPYRHVSSYVDLDAAELAEFTALTRAALATLRAASNPAGFNVGMNQGAVAGAGIAAHLHQHVVPRWAGDANFLPVVARTKALPELLEDTRRRLAEAWTAPVPAAAAGGEG